MSEIYGTKVSILVTYYNQEKYVDKSIKSIIDQKTNFDFEILVGDDGSSDGTVEKVKVWMASYPERIKLYCMNRENGVSIPGFRASQNRLNLLEHVSGEYFIFLDGDDYFDGTNKLQLQVDVLEKKENQDCVCCSHNIKVLYEDGTYEYAVSEDIKEQKFSLEDYWNKKIYFHTDTLLIRSEIIKNIPLKYFENNFNDNIITFFVLQFGKAYYIPKSMAVYYQTGTGIWTEGKRIINNIRNLFLYDICNTINPKVKKGTIFRFGYSWIELYKLRKSINVEELKEFDTEAKEKELVNSYLWIHYNDKNINNRIKLFLRMPIKYWKRIIQISLHDDPV